MGTNLVHPDLESLEDVELISLIQSGNERSIDVLLSRYRGLARSQARTRFLNGADRDDVVQEAMVGLYEAVMDFDLDQDTPFRAFAQMCISRQVLTAVKKASRIKHEALNSSVSLDAPAFSQDEESVSIAERLIAAAGDDPAERVIAAEELEALMDLLRRNLTELENAVLRMYMDGLPYQQMADALGHSTKGIDAALQRLRRKLARFRPIGGRPSMRTWRGAPPASEDLEPGALMRDLRSAVTPGTRYTWVRPTGICRLRSR